MKKYPRFCRQLAKGWTDFKMVSHKDSVLLPLDVDVIHLILYIAVDSRINKMDQKANISIVYLYCDVNADPEKIRFLNQFAKTRHFTYKKYKIDEPHNMDEYYESLTKIAEIEKCNKIALPDTLDYIDSQLLARMCSQGTFKQINMVEEYKKDIFFIRPFCYITDAEVAKFGSICKFENRDPSIRMENDAWMERAKAAVKIMFDESSNIQLNILHSQFRVKKKFMGAGDQSDDSYEDSNFD